MKTILQFIFAVIITVLGLTVSAQTVTTTYPTKYDAGAAQLNATFAGTFAGTPTFGFEYKLVSESDWDNASVVTNPLAVISGSDIQAVIKGLEYYKDYHYRAFRMHGTKKITGTVVAFKSFPDTNITTKQKLYDFRDYTKLPTGSGSNREGNCKGRTFHLRADITLDMIWTGIPAFSGTFDGHDYKINSFVIDWVGTPLGFIKTLNSEGRLLNLTIEGTLSKDCFTQNLDFGVFVGIDSGYIEGCHNKAPIFFTDPDGTATNQRIGGIAGKCTGNFTLKNCSNLVQIQNESVHEPCTAMVGGVCRYEPTKIWLGGIVGYVTGTGTWLIENCYNGNINILGANTVSTTLNAGVLLTRDIYTGGIVGYVDNSNASCCIKGCYNTGTQVKGIYAGGIVGFASGTSLFTITKCFNLGRITGATNTGGIAGAFPRSDNSLDAISLCFNKGFVNGSKAENGGYAGGIIGRITHNNTIINNCYNNTSFVQASIGGRIAGGITGSTSANNQIRNSYNVGSVEYGGISGNYTAHTVCNSFYRYPEEIPVSNVNTGFLLTPQEMKDAWDTLNRFACPAPQTVWGRDLSGTVNDGYPIFDYQINSEVTTEPATDVTFYSAQLNGTYTNIVGTNTVGFEYCEQGLPTSCKTIYADSAFSPFGVTVSGLKPNTVYEFKAIVKYGGFNSNEVLTKEGSIQTFTTDNLPAPCVTPTGLTVTTTSSNSATFSWTADAGQTEWVIAYKRSSSSNYTYINVKENPYTLNGLIAYTDYDVTVQAVCSKGPGDSSAVTAPENFKTDLPTCFSPVNLTYISKSHESITFTWSTQNNKEDYSWIIMYKPDTSSTWSYQTVTSKPATLTGLYSNVEYEIYVKSACSDIPKDTSVYADQGLEVTTNKGPCEAPSDITITDIDNHSLYIAWTTNNNPAYERKWVVSYKKDNKTTWTYDTVSANNVTLNNLSAGTLYDIRVQAICGDPLADNSTWTDTSHTTTGNPPRITGFSVIDSTTYSATFTAEFENVVSTLCQDGYGFQYYEKPCSTWTTVYAGTPSYTIEQTGLRPFTPYVVRAFICDGKDIIYSDTIVFNTRIEYNISDEWDLRGFRNYLDSGRTSSSETFRLMNSIALTSSSGCNQGTLPWSSGVFNATFDGQGNTISNFNSVSGTTLTGFVTTLKSTGVIRNLTLSGAYTLPNYSNLYAGAFAGDNQGEINGCTNQINITLPSSSSYTGQRVGGIAGQISNNGVISNCANAGIITRSTLTVICYVGGIVGYINGGGASSSITLCKNTANISGAYVGGIVGASAAASLTSINKSYNTGTIAAGTNLYAGGIIGYLNTLGLIDQCYNKGSVTAASGGYSGGIVGSVLNSLTQKITNCYNNSPKLANSSSYGGGIAGYYNFGDQNIKHSYNVTLVEASNKAAVAYPSAIASTENCRYINIVSANPKENIVNPTTGQSICRSIPEMKSDSIVTNLNAGQSPQVWYKDIWGVNNGYPIFEYSIPIDPVCMTPQNVSVEHNDTTFADIRWQSQNGETNWKIAYKARNSSLWNYITISTADLTTLSPPEYRLQNLTPNTQYIVMVSAICELTPLDTSLYSSDSTLVVTIPTRCDPPTNIKKTDSTANSITLNWTSGATQWKVWYAVSETNDWKSVTTTSKTYVLSGLLPDTPYDIMVSAICSATPGDTSACKDTLTTWTKPLPCLVPTGLTAQGIDTSAIYVSWTPQSGQTKWVIAYKPELGTTWSYDTVTVPNFTLTGLNANSYYDFRVSAICSSTPGNVSAYTNPVTSRSLPHPCLDPSNVVGISNSPTTIELSWNNDNNPPNLHPSLQWRIAYRVAGTTAWSYVIATVNPYILIGLNSNVTYDIKVSAWCWPREISDTSGYSSEIHIATLPPPCAAPTNIYVSKVTNTSAQINWTANNGSRDGTWVIEYKPVNSSAWTSVTVTTNPATLTGLNFGTEYDVKVRAKCSNTPGDTSDFVLGKPFTTTSEGIYVIIATSDAGGSITNYGENYVKHGDTIGFEISVQPGYVIVDVIVDGESQGSVVRQYGFYYVIANHTIHVVIQKVECIMPTGLGANNITHAAARLQWDYSETTLSYQIRYKKVGDSDDNYITISSGENNANVSELQRDTRYTWSVRAFCGQDNATGWSQENMFTTKKEDTGTGIEDHSLDVLKVYSYGTYVYIVNDDNLFIKQVQIMDMYGRTIYQGTVNDNPEIIKLNVATGIYNIRIDTGNDFKDYKLFISRF